MSSQLHGTTTDAASSSGFTSVPSTTTASSTGVSTPAPITPSNGDSDAPWTSHADSAARTEAEGRPADPFAAYSMPVIPPGYVVGKAAVLGGTKGVGNEGPGRDPSGDKYLYEVVRGFFKQNDPAYPRMSPEEMLSSSFGLIDESPNRWENFKQAIHKLRAEAPENVQYKVLFVGRHGQGYHNSNAAKYDAIEWEFVWAKLDGDGTETWGPDAELTPLGESQAQAVYKGWKANLAAGAPKPETFWVSPLTRTGETMRLSFGDILDGETPVFVEGLREIFGEHTCDKRRSKSYLQQRFPGYAFEEGFSEEDPWWKPDEREPEVDRRGRMRQFADKLFDEDENAFISLTSHSCAIRSLMAILNHVVIALETAEMIPIVVKATRQK